MLVFFFFWETPWLMCNRNFQQLKISIHQIEMKWKKKKKSGKSAGRFNEIEFHRFQ